MISRPREGCDTIKHHTYGAAWQGTKSRASAGAHTHTPTHTHLLDDAVANLLCGLGNGAASLVDRGLVLQLGGNGTVQLQFPSRQFLDLLARALEHRLLQVGFLDT